MEKIISCNICHHFDNGTNALSVISRIVQNAISVDRFGYLNKYSSWLVHNSEDKFVTTNYKGTQEEFDILINNRVNEIANKDSNNRIYITWSGGVDSTLILTSFLNSDIDKDRIVVLYSYSSIEEYPEMFDKLKKDCVNMIELTPFNIEYVYKSSVLDGILMTGDHADITFPSIYLLLYPEYYNTPYKDFLSWYIKDQLKYTNFEAIDQLEEAINYYNLPVKQTCELMWFIEFTIEWNRSRVHYGRPILGEYHKNFLTFFDTIDFQKWSLARFDLIKDLNIRDPKLYKKEMKSLIYKYTKDSNYCNNKIKEPSLGRLLGGIYANPFSVLTTDKYVVFDKFNRLNNRISMDTQFDYISSYLNKFQKHLN